MDIAVLSRRALVPRRRFVQGDRQTAAAASIQPHPVRRRLLRTFDQMNFSIRTGNPETSIRMPCWEFLSKPCMYVTGFCSAPTALLQGNFEYHRATFQQHWLDCLEARLYPTRLVLKKAGGRILLFLFLAHPGLSSCQPACPTVVLALTKAEIDNQLMVITAYGVKIKIKRVIAVRVGCLPVCSVLVPLIFVSFRRAKTPTARTKRCLGGNGRPRVHLMRRVHVCAGESAPLRLHRATV